MNPRILFIFVVIQVLSLYLHSCDNYSKLTVPDYTPSLAIPVFSSTITAGNILPTRYSQVDSNGFVRLVYRQTLFDGRPDAATLQLPNTPVSVAQRLSNIRVDNLTDSLRIPFSMLVDNLSPTLAAQLRAANGQRVPVSAIPAQGGGSYSVGFNGTQPQIIAVTLQTGTIDISVRNDLPVVVSAVVVLRNPSTNAQILRFTFTNIPANGGTARQQQSLAGLTFSNPVSAVLESFSSPGTSAPVLVNLNSNALTVRVQGTNLTAESGTVLGPVTFRDTSRIQIPTPNGEQLSQATFSAASFLARVASSIHSNGSINFTVLNGSSPSGARAQGTLTITNGVSPEQTVSFAGQNIDLSDGGRSTNTLRIASAVSIGRAGERIQFSRNDSLAVIVRLQNAQLSAAQGDFGQRPINFRSATASTDIYEALPVVNLRLDDPRLRLVLTNSLGVPFSAQFRSLSVLSYRNQRVAVRGTVLERALNIPAANVSQPAVTRIELNRTNSNIADALSAAPKQLEYDISGTSNPAGRTMTNFFTPEGKFTVDAELEVPLQLSVRNLVFQDTIAFDGSIVQSADSAQFFIRTANSLPVGVEVQVLFLNSGGRITDSLITGSRIIANPARTDASGRPVAAENATANISLSKTRLTNVASANRAIIRAGAQSSQQGATSVRIFADNTLRITVSAITSLRRQIP